MPRTLLSRAKRGFTLIEMSVTITIVAILATMVAPRVKTYLDQRDVISFVNSLPGIAAEARLAAIKQNQTTKLEYNAAANQLVIMAEDPSAGDTQVDFLPVPKAIQLADFAAAGQTSSPTGWTVSFYPDGTSTGGGLSTNDHGIIRSLVIDKNGLGRAQAGPIPDQSNDSWPAGNYDQRTT